MSALADRMTQSTTALTIPSFSPAWKRVEEHYGTACRLGRQSVEEAWHCGDALIGVVTRLLPYAAISSCSIV